MHTAGDRRVIVGVSGSLGSVAALHRAADEAYRTGRRLCAALVWDQPPVELGRCSSFPSPGLLEKSRRAAEVELASILDSAFGCIGPAVPIESRVLWGTPGRALVEAAHGEDDLLVVGSGHRGLLHRALHPSVAKYCLVHAFCPVLTVPPPALQYEIEAASRRNTLRLRLDTRELDISNITEV